MLLLDEFDFINDHDIGLEGRELIAHRAAEICAKMQSVKIHLFGMKPEGKLERPFKAPANPLAEMLGADPNGEKDDEKAVARKPKPQTQNKKKD